MSDGKIRRIFVAIDLPDSHKKQIQTICHGLSNVRWLHLEDFHMTLRFIGNVSEERFHLIQDILYQLPSQKQFSLQIKEVGFFGRPFQPRVVWVGARRSRELISLQSHVEKILVEKAKILPETREYRPHVTIARPKKNSSFEIESFLMSHKGFHLPKFEVKEFALYESHLSKSGPRYEKIKVYTL